MTAPKRASERKKNENSELVEMTKPEGSLHALTVRKSVYEALIFLSGARKSRKREVEDTEEAPAKKKGKSE